MRELIEKVKQWGLDRNIVFTGAEGQDKRAMMEAQARYTLKETAELLDAYADQDIDKINDAVGDILVTLIVGASSDDDIFDSLIDWFDECNDNFSRYGIDELSSFDAAYVQLVYSEFDILHDNNPTCNTYPSAILRLDDTLDIVNWEFGKQTSLKDCLELAYSEIKNRAGKVVNGQFIKDK